jgi:hypothetical protein
MNLEKLYTYPPFTLMDEDERDGLETAAEFLKLGFDPQVPVWWMRPQFNLAAVSEALFAQRAGRGRTLWFEIEPVLDGEPGLAETAVGLRVETAQMSYGLRWPRRCSLRDPATWRNHPAVPDGRADVPYLSLAGPAVEPGDEHTDSRFNVRSLLPMTAEGEIAIDRRPDIMVGEGFANVQIYLTPEPLQFLPRAGDPLPCQAVLNAPLGSL